MNITFSNVKISGIQSAIPSNKLEFSELVDIYGKDEVTKIIRTTGIQSVRIAKESITASDLCYEAAKKLLSELHLNAEDITGLIFVSQTRDYILPQTSSVLQSKLGLPNSTVCFDLPLGCSGYIYGLYQASLLIGSNSCERVLVLAGDTTSKIINPLDRASRMVFGDAGTATLIEKGNDSMTFEIMNDGSGYNQLIVPAGGFRNPKNSETGKIKEFEDGNHRTDEDLYMDGLAIFNFANSKVPKMISNFLNNNNRTPNDVNFFYFHQANKFMVETLSKRLKIEKDRVPLEIENVGNTGPASIPLTISLSNKKQPSSNRDNVILCGFGVGLSWGVCNANLNSTKILNVIEI